MKIQEMKSGRVHFKKTDKRGHEDIPGLRDAPEAEGSWPVEPRRDNVELISEIDRPAWSVVSFTRCEAHGLPYRQAADIRSQLEARGVTGLCIVTDNAGKKVKG
jgi:hypothetical protein